MYNPKTTNLSIIYIGRRHIVDLTVNKIADDLGVSTKTIYRRIASGELPALRLAANCIRIDEADYSKFKQNLKARQPYTRKTV